jgi:pyridoxal phosphate enzyme (YggS family)
MKSIKNKLSEIKSKIDEKVTVVAVSKTKPIDDILKLYEDGHFDFGENKVQELIVKNKELPKDIKWHMIGHLQRNKVKQIISFIHLIHSVDSIRVLNKINDEAKKINRKVNVLLQVKISENDLKYGFDLNEVQDFLKEYDFVNVLGLMGMASFTQNNNIINDEFKALNSIYSKFKKTYNFTTLSIGMSGDYELALKNNSNMLRLGSIIFGHRS